MKKFLHLIATRRARRAVAVLPRKSKAQSLTEFAIALPVLFILLSGVVEFGFALNYYLSLLDATREAARYYSDGDPFDEDGADDINFYSNTAALALSNLDPTIVPGNEAYQGRRIPLDSATDDIIVTVYTKSEDGVLSYPTAGPYQLYGHATSKFDTTEISSRFESGSPNAGILVVEVHYNYHQVMKLPWLSPFVPDPFTLTAYSIMPLAAAEPVEATPTP
jgi:hypothetical protein